MRSFGQTIALLCAMTAMTAVPAQADVVGNWRVSGDIAGRAFIVDCRFVPNGHDFGGTCIDAATGDKSVSGKTHVLSKGTTAGTAVRWSYPTKVFFLSIDINFAGTISGNRIAGTVSAKGNQGTFTAIRQ